jgi:hypothetical protein
MSDAGMDDGALLAWCVVANVLAETARGEGGQDVRPGLKHFAPGAKMWVLPPQWGDGGEKVMVIGRHRGRGQGRLARMVVGRHQLAGFRVRGVYSPAVHRELVRPWKPWGDHPLKLWDSRDEAEQSALWWNSDHATRSGVRQPRQRGDLVDILALLVAPQPWQPLPYGIGRMVSGFFNDPPDPANTVSTLLRDRHEVAAIDRVLDPLRAIVGDLSPTADRDDYLNHQRWPEVVAAADAARVLLTGSVAVSRTESTGRDAG